MIQRKPLAQSHTETGTVTGVADRQSHAQPQEWECTLGAIDNTQAWVAGRVKSMSPDFYAAKLHILYTHCSMTALLYVPGYAANA